MSNRAGIGKNRIVLALLMIFFLFAGSRGASAHNPHDIIEASALSPNFDQDQTVFVAVTVEGLFKSTDGGSSWKQLVNGLDNVAPVSAIAISPAYELDQTVFMSTEGQGIYRSRNGGRSWSKVNSGLGHLSIDRLSISAAYETDQSLLAADSQGRLYRSGNGGDRWEQVLDKAAPTRAITSFVDRQSTLTLRGNQRGVLSRSADGGESWPAIYHFSGAGPITSIAVSPHISKDGTLFVGTEAGGIFKSVDRGHSFTAVNNGLSDSWFSFLGNYAPKPYKSIRSLAISPRYETDATLYASTWYEGVYRSNDGGKSWQRYDQGLTSDKQADTPQYKSPHFRKLSLSTTFDRDQTIFLEGYDGLFKTTDGGRHWTQLETLSVSQIWRLDVSPGDETDSTIAFTTALAGIYTLDRPGLTWAINNSGLEDIALMDLAFSPDYQTDNTLFLTSDDFIFKSMDRGRSWNAVDLRRTSWRTEVKTDLRGWGVPKRVVKRIPFLEERAALKESMLPRRIAVSPHFAVDKTLYFGSRKHGVYRSVDGGLTWSPVWEDRTIYSLLISPDFAADQTLFAGTRDEGVYKSVDRGHSWQPANNGLAPALTGIELPDSVPGGINLIISPDYKSDQTLFAGSAAGLFKTTNGGASWQKLAGIPFGGQDIEAMAISPDYKNDQTLIFNLRGRGLLKSRDGGQTFTQIGTDLIGNNYDPNMLEFSPAYAADRTIYGVSDEAIFQSTNGGQSWQILPRPVRYEDRREFIRYEGDWKVLKGDGFSAASVTQSEVAQDKAILNFVGTGITWLGASSNDQGIARVYLDGQYRADVDQFSQTEQVMVTSFSATDLEAGAHTLAIEVSDTKNRASTGHRIVIDALDVMTGPVVLEGR